MLIWTKYKEKNQGNLSLTLIFASIKELLKIFGVILIYGYVYKNESHLFKIHTKTFKDEMIMISDIYFEWSSVGQEEEI